MSLNPAKDFGRVLMVTTVARTAEAFLLPYAAALRRGGWHVDLATGKAPFASALTRSFDNIKCISWSRSLISIHKLFCSWREMRELLRHGSYDIVHVHTPIAAAITRLAAIGVGRPARPYLVYTAHGFHFHRNGSRVRNEAFAAFEKVLGRWTDVLIVINEDDEREALKRGLVTHGTVFYTPGIGISREEYTAHNDRQSLRMAVRKSLKLSSEAKVIIMVAEFNRGKRHDTAIRALAALRRPDTHIIFAGAGPKVREMRELADKLGLSDHCHFLGYCNNVRELLIASDVLVLPSEREGLARCVMEAMAAELPVIGADSRGIADLLRGNCGVLHPLGDHIELAKALELVLSNPAFAKELTQNATIRIAECDVTRVVAWHIELYAALLAKVPLGAQRVRHLRRTSSKAADAAPRVVIVAGVAASLINFRWDLLVELRRLGADVVAIAGDFDSGVCTRLAGIGVSFCTVTMQRAGMSPLADVFYYFGLRKLLKQYMPDVVLAYTHKPVIYSAFCKKSLQLRRVRCFGLITGLGYSFVEGDGDSRRKFAKYALCWLYRRSLTWSNGVMFQNADDRKLFERERILPARLPTRVVSGSGVNIKHFALVPCPSEPLFLLVGRLLIDKGVGEFIEAAAFVKEKFPGARFVLVGGRDENPRSISVDTINSIRASGIVEVVGPVRDVRPYIAACSVFVLPSYREGTPRTVLEAMAVGRAVITTDAPGCRDTIADCEPLDSSGVGKGKNGYLVVPKSASALASAMLRCIGSSSTVAAMGVEGRRIAESRYDVRLVNDSMTEFMGLQVPLPGQSGDSFPAPADEEQ